MVAYIVTQIEITDPETFETYRAQVPPILEKYGGEFIVRGGILFLESKTSTTTLFQDRLSHLFQKMRQV